MPRATPPTSSEPAQEPILVTARHRWAPETVRQLLLIALTVATGSVDAISWLILGKVFSAFMTGNLVFLGLVAGGADGPDPTHVTVAIVAFGVGAAFGGRILASARNRKGWWPFEVSLALGCTAVLEAGVLGVWKSCDADPSAATTVLLIAMLSLAMGTQTIAIASLGVRGIFTTAATATLAMLMGDAAGWPHLKGEVGRLGTVVIALVAGAGIGGLLVDRAPLWAPLFPVCVTMLVVTGAALLFNNPARYVEQPGA